MITTLNLSNIIFNFELNNIYVFNSTFINTEKHGCIFIFIRKDKYTANR